MSHGDNLLAQPRPTALLVYLALARPAEFQRRDHLVGLFWPESDQEHARSNLRKLIFTLRRMLGDTAIESRGDEEIRLSPNALWCDAAEYAHAVRVSRLSRAIELYRGPLLLGFFVPAAAPFQEWLELTRRNFSREAVKAALKLAEEHVSRKERTEVGDLVQFVRQLEAELQDEHQLRKLIDLLEQIGDRASALSLYESFRARLWREYRALPSQETRKLVEHIRTL